MDIVSLLGIIIALVALLGGNLLEGGTWQSLVNMPAALIVFGGTLGAALLQTPLKILNRAIVMSGWVFFPPKVEFKKQVRHVSDWAGQARKGGLLALEKIANRERNPFAKKALNLLVDGTPPQDIRHILESDIQLYENRDLQAAKVFSTMGGYSPTIGILGAVMGLIYVMKNLGDPSQLGPGIAIAFVATIYGVALANLLLLPMANKLVALIQEQTEIKEIITEGVLYIAEGENPKSIEMKLSAYIN